MKVPTWATPGYDYEPHAYRSDDLSTFTNLDIHEFFQVCTLKASKSTVRRGTKVKVSGVVPTQGHWGASTPGISKPVTLFAHKGTAKVPTKWAPKSQGWVKVGSMKANGYGKYTSPSFKPLRTLTLVVRYPGDDWYWGACTGARKITVR